MARLSLACGTLKNQWTFGSGNLSSVGWRAVTDRKPYRHLFPLSVIGYALRLYHRFPLSQRDVQELLHERGIQVSHETLRQWNIKFAPLLTEELRHREPRRGSLWFLDEVYVEIGGRKHWLWRAVVGASLKTAPSEATLRTLSCGTVGVGTQRL